MPFIIGFLTRFFATLFARSSAWLIALVASLAGPLIKAFLKLTSNIWKIGLGLAAIVLAIGVFAKAIDLAISTIAESAPDELLVIGQMIMPSNVPLCLSVLLLARIKSLIFFWIVRITEKFERS